MRPLWRSRTVSRNGFRVTVVTPAASLYVEMTVPCPMTRFPTALKRLMTIRADTVPATLLAPAVGAVGRASALRTTAASAARMHTSTASEAAWTPRGNRIFSLLVRRRRPRAARRPDGAAVPRFADAETASAVAQGSAHEPGAAWTPCVRPAVIRQIGGIPLSLRSRASGVLIFAVLPALPFIAISGRAAALASGRTP